MAGAQFGLQIDRPRLGDQVIEHAGATVLLVDESLADALSDATIDTEQTHQSDDLVIVRPRENNRERGNEETAQW